MGQAVAGPSPAVRRSPLESARDALAAPRDGTRDAPQATLAEIGPYDKLLVLGPGSAETIEGLLRTGGPPPPQTIHVATVSGRQVEAWLIGPDETLLLLEAAEAPGEGTAAELRGGIRDGASIVDVSSGWTVLQLSGPAAPAVLAELLTVDADPRSLAAGSLVQGPLAGVRSIVARREGPADPEYAILVARDYALYCWDALIEVGAAHGLGGTSAAPGPEPRVAEATR